MKVCVITDNLYIFENFTDLLARRPGLAEVDFYYTSWNEGFREKFGENGAMHPIKLKEQPAEFFDGYDLFLSLHCKQLFPEIMVRDHRCINVHPGLNPYNRGWFPQVFGILNRKPIGVTIHEMDVELDHGPILYQKELTLRDDDTSKDIYQRILAAEMELLEAHFEDILSGNYTPIPMTEEGNMNTKQDFDRLCELDMNQPATYREVIDRLRALTFAPYQNAYFYDENGDKIFVGITLKRETND